MRNYCLSYFDISLRFYVAIQFVSKSIEQAMTKQDILKEIKFYEIRKLEDPEGKDLYDGLIEALRRELKKYEKTK